MLQYSESLRTVQSFVEPNGENQTTSEKVDYFGDRNPSEEGGKEAVSTYLAIPTPGNTTTNTLLCFSVSLYAPLWLIHANNQSEWLPACMNDFGAYRNGSKSMALSI